MTKVKICGITNLEDAQAAVKAGCDALGFIFYKKSPRYITPAKAAKIAKSLPKGIFKIGVFVDSTEKNIKRIAETCGLDMLQFHGHESPELCRRLRQHKIIKVLHVKNRLDTQNMLRYKPFAWLFDTFNSKKMGGTGKGFDWALIRNIKVKEPIFLSGGLNAANVGKAIKLIHPDWVDVSTSLETRPGKKDHKRIREFINAAKKVAL